VISHLNKSFVGEGGGSSPGFSVAFCRDFAQIPSQLQNAPEFSAILQVGVQWFSDGWKKSPVSSRGWLCHALPIHVYVHVCRSIMSWGMHVHVYIYNTYIYYIYITLYIYTLTILNSLPVSWIAQQVGLWRARYLYLYLGSFEWISSRMDDIDIWDMLTFPPNMYIHTYTLNFCDLYDTKDI